MKYPSLKTRRGSLIENNEVGSDILEDLKKLEILSPPVFPESKPSSIQIPETQEETQVETALVKLIEIRDRTLKEEHESSMENYHRSMLSYAQWYALCQLNNAAGPYYQPCYGFFRTYSW